MGRQAIRQHLRTLLGWATLTGLVLSPGLVPGCPLAAQSRPATAGDASRQLADLRKQIEADNQNHPTASIPLAEKALALVEGGRDPQAEFGFLRTLVRDLYVLSDYPKADAYLARARDLVARTGNRRDHLRLEVEAGSLLSGEDRSADAKALLDALLPQMESYRQANPQDAEFAKDLARGYRVQGAVARNLGRFAEAITAFDQGQKVCEAYGDRKGQANILNHIGSLYGNLGRFDEAVATHRLALAAAEAMSDPELQATFHLALANTFGSMNKTDLQLAELVTAEQFAGTTQDADIQSVCKVNMADVFLRRKDYRAALKAADAALKLPATASSPGSIAVCQVNRGIALNRLGDSAQGLKAIVEALGYFKATQAMNDYMEITGDLAEEYAFSRDYRKAYETQLQFKTLSDALKRDQDQKRIADAAAVFENDKNRIEIRALQREKRIQLRLRLLWAAMGLLGFAIAGLLVVNRRKLQGANRGLTALNDQNLNLIVELQTALAEVRTLQGLIPICAQCKKIRDDQGYWSQMEAYIQSRSEATFSHGLCPDCAEEVMAEFKRELDSR